ncbi:MAG: adenosylcobinamide-GDP ribazoletransferase [Chloroflexi bacterium]|nr:adenosylcobinamide-GDP ribazoletransferase [Chloroflexota bacterium]
MGFLVALRFLTIIPAPGLKEIKPKDRAGSLAYFPLVGLVLGLILVIVNLVLTFLAIAGFPALLIDLALVTVLILLTGALHLDGFIDSCDGVFAARTPEERLGVMKDTRVGAFGVVGVVVLLLTKLVALTAFPTVPGPLMGAFDSLLSAYRLPILLLMPVLARWATVYAIVNFPAARKEGTGFEFKQYARWPGFLVATVITLAIAIGVGLVPGYVITEVLLLALVLMVLLSLMVSAVAYFVRKRLGGLTGDNYGAITELSEAGVLLFTLVYFSVRLLLG